MNKVAIIGLLVFVLFVDIPFYWFYQYRHYVQVANNTTIEYWASHSNLYGMLRLWNRLVFFKIINGKDGTVYVNGKQRSG